MKQGKVKHQWAVGDGKTSNISLGTFGIGGGHGKPIIVNDQYIVGENVPYYAEPKEAMGIEWYIDNEGRIMFYASLAQVLEPGKTELNVVFTLPVEAIERDDNLISKVRRWIEGGHNFTVNENEYLATIPEARGQSQPITAYFDWGMNDFGKWIQGERGIKQRVIVFDIGGGTADLAVIENRTILKRYTTGTIGILGATRNIQKALSLHGMNYSIMEIDTILRSRDRIIASNGFDANDIVDDALGTLESDLIKFLRDKIGTGAKAAKILMVGGGSKLIGKRLVRAYPKTVIPSNAVYSPAAGARKLAWAKWESDVAGVDFGNAWMKIVK